MTRLAAKLASRSGEKTSTLEGLGRLKADSHKQRGARHKERHDRSREANARERDERNAEREQRRQGRGNTGPPGFADSLASRAQEAAVLVDRFLRGTIERDRQHAPAEPDRGGAREPAQQSEARPDPQPQHDHGGHGGGHDR